MFFEKRDKINRSIMLLSVSYNTISIILANKLANKRKIIVLRNGAGITFPICYKHSEYLTIFNF